MTADQRTQFIRQCMLQVLADCGAYMLPEPAFLNQVNLTLYPPATRTEFEAQLRWLDTEAYIAGLTPELGGPVKWKITDRGRAAL